MSHQREHINKEKETIFYKKNQIEILELKSNINEKFTTEV